MVGAVGSIFADGFQQIKAGQYELLYFPELTHDKLQASGSAVTRDFPASTDAQDHPSKHPSAYQAIIPVAAPPGITGTLAGPGNLVGAPPSCNSGRAAQPSAAATLDSAVSGSISIDQAVQHSALPKDRG